MNDQTMGHGTDEIAALLADRQRIQGWLERLGRSTGSAPEPVRARVRADYEARLSEVVSRLGSFSAALSESLEDVRARQAELEGQRSEVEETLAEAELRHAVGEYTDSQWEALARGHGGRIDALSGQIGQLADEAARLAEVLAQVAPPEPEAPAPEPPPATERELAADAHGDELEADIEVIEVEEVSLTSRAVIGEEDVPIYDAPEAAATAGTEPMRQVPVEAPRFTPKPGMEPRPRERAMPRTLRFPAPPAPAEPPAVDEMTFLKSVTLDTGAPPRERGGEGRGTRSARGGNTASKTLKCTECGAMNRPTEWYCERCGAELAAV
jgi:hypothetical protein